MVFESSMINILIFVGVDLAGGNVVLIAFARQPEARNRPASGCVAV